MLAPLLLFSLILAGFSDPGLAEEKREAIDLRELELEAGRVGFTAFWCGNFQW